MIMELLEIIKPNPITDLIRNNPLVLLYFASLVVDLLLGNIRAWTINDVDSSVGVKGTLKHMGLLTFVVVFLPTLTFYLQSSSVSTAVLGYLTYQYAISIIENLGLLGFKLPAILEESFRRLGTTSKIDISDATKVEIDTNILKNYVRTDKPDNTKGE